MGFVCYVFGHRWFYYSYDGKLGVDRPFDNERRLCLRCGREESSFCKPIYEYMFSYCGMVSKKVLEEIVSGKRSLPL